MGEAYGGRRDDVERLGSLGGFIDKNEAYLKTGQ